MAVTVTILASRFERTFCAEMRGEKRRGQPRIDDDDLMAVKVTMLDPRRDLVEGVMIDKKRRSIE